jgi:PAS/PAC sensor hybrid histidine kinase
MTKVKILLVEDDKSLREIYGVRLLAEGYDIVSAGDGEEALAMAIKERPQLIISDVMMPKISGFDMLDILRSTTETRGIKVIIMTALSSQDQRMRGEALGADRYLVKSQVGIEDVVRAVHDVLGDTGVSHRPAAHTTPEPQLSAPAMPVPPASQPTTLPQPTAPFSTPRPASLGERVIHPLQSSMPRPDYASLIDDELDAANGAPQPTAPQPPADLTTPQPFTLPPAAETPEAEIVTHHDEHLASASDAPSPAEAPHPHTPPASDAPTAQPPLINDIITPHSTAPSGIPEITHQALASKPPLPPHHTHTPADDEAELAEALRMSTQQADDEADTDAAAYQPSQNQLVTDAVANLTEQMDTMPTPVEPLTPATTAHNTSAPSHPAPAASAQPPATHHEHHEDSPAHPTADSAAITPHSPQAIAADPSDALAAALLQGSAAAHPSVSPVDHPLYDAIRPAPVATAHSAPAQPVNAAAGQPSITHHAASAPQPEAAPSRPAPAIQHSHDNLSFEETERATPSSAGSH